MKKNKLLQVEYDESGEKVEIIMNDVGIKELISQLEYLLNQKGPDHVHLMTESWGGDELTEGKCEDGYKLINQMKLYRRETEN